MLSQIDSSKHTHVSRKITPYMAGGVTVSMPDAPHISPPSLFLTSRVHVSLNSKECCCYFTGPIHVSYWNYYWINSGSGEVLYIWQTRMVLPERRRAQVSFLRFSWYFNFVLCFETCQSSCRLIFILCLAGN